MIGLLGGSRLPLARLSDTYQNKIATSCSISHAPTMRISILTIPRTIGITPNESRRLLSQLKEASLLPIYNIPQKQLRISRTTLYENLGEVYFV